MIKSKFFSLLRFLKLYFYYTGRPKYLNPIFYLRLIANFIYHQKLIRVNDGELIDLVQELLKKSKSTSCNYADLYLLYYYVIYRKPISILELGSGISTVVMAYALDKLNTIHGIQGKITTMEESEFYYNDFIKIIPNHLTKYINPILSPRVTSIYQGVKACSYKEIPSCKHGYELVFIDGPQTHLPTDPIKAFDSDLIFLIRDNKLRNPLILLDQRISSMLMLNKFIPNLDLRYNPINMLSKVILDTKFHNSKILS